MSYRVEEFIADIQIPAEILNVPHSSRAGRAALLRAQS
jgi:hypothetical protein